MENMPHCVFRAFVFMVATTEITGLQFKGSGEVGVGGKEK